MKNDVRYIEEGGIVRLAPGCGDILCNEYGKGRGCVELALDYDIPVQIVVREVKSRTGSNKVRF